LSPQLDTTNGQLIITSTPPENLTHPYIEEIALAESGKYLFSHSILESLACGEMGNELHAKIIQRCNGVDSDSYRREYLIELVANKSRLVIPEAHESATLWGVQERPSHFHSYVGMDLGLKDHTAALFGQLDFLNARLIIEREFVEHYMSTKEIVDNCKAIEEEMEIRPYKRIADCELQQLFDMDKDHGYHVSPIQKRQKQSNEGFLISILNQLRLGISQQRILINRERCPKLAMQLKFGLWNERRTDFMRSDKMGHLDALMALAYLYDNIEWNKNPYPHEYASLDKANSYFSTKANKMLQSKGNLRKMIGRR
jgi:hypothetical protein